MIPLRPPPEPPDFDRRVRQEGNRWLADHPGVQPSQYKDFWNLMRQEVQEGFQSRCAYLGHWISSGQVDHFVAKAEDRLRVYEWSNYRWAEARLNMKKSTSNFLDPFEIAGDWIVIDPVTLHYRVTDRLPSALCDTAHRTLAVLNDEELRGSRREALRFFQRPDGSIDYLPLEPFFPLLARCLREAGFPQSGV